MAYQGPLLKSGNIVKHRTEDWYGIVLKQRLPDEPDMFWVLKLEASFYKAFSFEKVESQDVTPEARNILNHLMEKQESLVSAPTEMLRQALSDLERSYDITLEALGDALDLKDAETEGHSKRVTAFTIHIARTIGLPPDRIRVIARGAFLHDVGMMAIPDATLRKTVHVSPAEQAILRQHALLGYQMLRKIPFLHEAADIVHSHHERFDGSGYPRGLKGEQIPLGARILAIADTFDAMTSDRPYRAAQSISSGRREIERQSGKQFDPEIVKVFLTISEQVWQELRSEIRPVRYKA
jgi:putative nucleotidyltransferase with HDIG domain